MKITHFIGTRFKYINKYVQKTGVDGYLHFTVMENTETQFKTL